MYDYLLGDTPMPVDGTAYTLTSKQDVVPGRSLQDATNYVKGDQTMSLMNKPNSIKRTLPLFVSPPTTTTNNANEHHLVHLLLAMHLSAICTHAPIHTPFREMLKATQHPTTLDAQHLDFIRPLQSTPSTGGSTDCSRPFGRRVRQPPRYVVRWSVEFTTHVL